MRETVLKVEGISKRYRKGIQNSRSLKQNMGNWWKGKNGIKDGTADDYIWALKDVSFELNQGDVLGFIGRNGAGKSTLLKIISKIVIPTEGKIRGSGRVGSLLEVGTGFHAELTGRENIFLNGTILGMKTRDVKAKFDTIVDFSGIESFLDTPVKRYSSGMYMRLAFAVAAHLDSEILIIDEVLAVGDLDFQQKCMNKIKDVAREEGRTIIFVSHNIHAVRSLCNLGLFLNEGRLDNFGKTDHVINSYITKSKAYVEEQNFSDLQVRPGNDYVRIQKVSLAPYTTNPAGTITLHTSILLSVEFLFTPKDLCVESVDFKVFNFQGDYIFNISSGDSDIPTGLVIASCIIPANFLNSGSYYISVHFMHRKGSIFELNKCLSFYLEDQPQGLLKFNNNPGIITPNFSVEVQTL